MAKSVASRISMGKGMGPMFNVIMVAFLFVLAFLIYQMVVGGKGGEGFSDPANNYGPNGPCIPRGKYVCPSKKKNIHR